MKNKGIPHQRSGQTRPTRTKLYRVWAYIKQRCWDKNYPSYSYYGGDGVKLCKAWQRDFLKFAKDVGKPPTKTSALNLIHRKLGYRPGNVKWEKQAIHHSPNMLWTKFEGADIPVYKLSQTAGMDYQTVKARLDKGISLKKAIIPKVPRRKKSLTLQGKTLTIERWAVRLGITERYVRHLVDTNSIKKFINR